MNTKHFVIALATAGMLFTTSGCKKDKPATENEEVAVVKALETKVNLDDWKKEDVNGLLKFIPADSPLVYVSTRNVDSSSSFYGNMLKKFKNLEGPTKTFFGEVMANDKMDESDKALLEKLRDYMTDFMKDPNAKLIDMGINPDRTDFAFYYSNHQFVFKMTTEDSDKIKNAFAGLINLVPENEREKFLAELKQEFGTPKDVKLDDQNWIFLSIPLDSGFDEDKKVETLDLAIHMGKNIITIVSADGKIDGYNDFLIPAGNPLDKSKLGDLNRNVAYYGYVDNGEIFSRLMTPDFKKIIEDEFDFKLTDDCVSEFASIVSDFPKVTVSYEITNDEAKEELVLQFKNKDTLAKIQDLHSPSIHVVTDQALLGLSLNVDVSKLLQLIVESSKDVSTKQYKCEVLAGVAKALPEIPELLSSPEVSMVTGFLNGISGVNIAIDDVDLNNIEKLSENKSKGLINITGNGLGKTVPMVFALVGTKMPALLKLKPGMDSAISLDISKFINEPYELSAFMTDSDLFVGTPGYDLKTIANNSRTDDKKFVEYSANITKLMKVAMSLDDFKVGRHGSESKRRVEKAALDFVNALLNEFNMSYSYSLGTNADGFVAKGVMKM